MKILYVEDDPAARLLVENGLREHGYVVDTAATLELGLERARSGGYDAIILDVMLPDGEGFELLERLRAANSQVPVLFLSARGEVADRLEGFRRGADDYLPKPFAMSELRARLRAIARRGSGLSETTVRVGDLEVDLDARSVTRAERRIPLSPKLYGLLELLARSPGRVVSREQIIEKVWGYEAEPRSNALTVLVHSLRQKIDRDFDRPLIHTRAGLGYVLEDVGPAESEGD